VRYRQGLIGGVLCALMAAAPALPAAAADDAKGQPTATIDVASEQMRLIMGGTAGKGVLHFNGKDYPFSFKSASVGVGAKMVTKMSASGKVYGLNRIEDFGGQYSSVSQSTMAGSAKVSATYKNDKGVTIDLRGTTEGAGLSLGGGVATVVTLAK